MKNKEKVSIIVPVYQAENYLEKCVKLILEQTYKYFELILVDDGSKDNSGSICDEYAEKDKRIKVIHKENGGASSARNKALDVCQGKYVTFVDSDDYIEKDYLEKMVKKLEEKGVDVIGCASNKIYYNSTEKVSQKEDYEINSQTFTKWLFLQKGIGICRCKLYKKEAIGDIRFNEKLQVGEDTYFNLLVAKNINKFYMLNQPLYNYVVNDESLVRKLDDNYINKYLEASIITNDYVKENYKNNNEIIKLVNNYIAFTLTLIIVNYCCNSKRSLTLGKEANEIKQVCKIREFEYAIKNVSFKYFSLPRKIMILTIKLRLYLFTAMIGNVRQRQINKRDKRNDKKNKKFFF